MEEEVRWHGTTDLGDVVQMGSYRRGLSPGRFVIEENPTLKGEWLLSRSQRQ